MHEVRREHGTGEQRGPDGAGRRRAHPRAPAGVEPPEREQPEQHADEQERQEDLRRDQKLDGKHQGEQQDKAAPAKSATNKNEQNASATGEWQGSKLIGLNVYNGQNEKIGDIKELMVNKEGRIDTVVIAVGGFLGMGEHDVAIKFSELKWQDEPVRSTTSSSTRPSGSPTTGAAPTATNNSTSAKRNNYPDHAVLDASKDQLKSMPQFNYNK